MLKLVSTFQLLLRSFVVIKSNVFCTCLISALPRLKSEYEELRATLKNKQNALMTCAQHTEELVQQCASLESATEAQRAAFATQSALRDEEIAALRARLAEVTAHRHSRYQVLQDLHKECGN